MFLVIPEQVANEDGRKIDAGEGGGPTGADGSHRGRTKPSIDEKPVANGVDDVRGHQRKGDGANHVHALHATPYCEIKQKGQRAPGHCLGIGDGHGNDVRCDARETKQWIEEPDWRHEERSKSDAEINAVQKRTMAIFAAARTESLRNKCVQANQKPAAKKRQHVNKNATQANGGNGHGAWGAARPSWYRRWPYSSSRARRGQGERQAAKWAGTRGEVSGVRAWSKTRGTSLSGAERRSKKVRRGKGLKRMEL